jgi:hypothetical protein
LFNLNIVFMKYCSLFFLLLSILVLNGCIKDAPQNPEADIETFTVDTTQLTGSIFIDQANRRIMLYLQPSAYNNGIAPVITVSNGATVVPASGDTIRFGNGKVQYTVTSQSGANKKVYDVLVVDVGTWTFNFEKWQQNSADKYEYPVEDNNTILWSSGNAGVALSGIPKQPQAYPTHSTADGFNGTTGAEMVTLAGTPLSALVGIHLFAGSLFLGNFNSAVAFTQPLAATEFGQPYVGLPSAFTGYYKYTPGTDYQDESGNIVAGILDECSLYAVLFRGSERLNGTNILTSDRIIAKALLPDGSAKSAFTKFELPFTYVPGADTTGPLLLAIVASSSKDGDHYKGAVGSRLVVDSLRIIHP